MSSAVIDNPKTFDGFALMLHYPVPEFALVCFDNHPTRTAPLWFQRAANKLSATKQFKFLQCVDKDTAAFYNVTEFPTYAVFQCGPEPLELARWTSASRDTYHVEALVQFALTAVELDPLGTDDDTTYSYSHIRSATARRLADEARTKVNAALLYLSQKFDITPPFKLSTFGRDCSVKIGDNHITIKAGGRGCNRTDGTCQFRAYLGARGQELKHENNDALLREMLMWNFNGDFLNGFTLGVEQRTGKFTMECTKHILEDRFNEMTFENILFNFSNAIDATKKKIQELLDQDKKEETKKKDEEEDTTTTPSARELREKRLTKLGCPYKEEDPTECSSNDSSSGSESEEEELWRCEVCRKEFHSENQLNNHLRSKKHKRAWKRFQEQQEPSPEDEPVLVLEEEPEEEEHREPAPEAEPKRRRRYTKEQQDRRRHRKLLKERIAQDKKERKANGGKLKSKLGADGYRPTGTHYDIDQ